jgi:hypothetical protein
MAKGWESKAVESQMQDSTSGGDNKKPRTNVAQIESHRRREVLLLSRARVVTDLEASTDSRYREQLNRALADLEAQLARLSN